VGDDVCCRGGILASGICGEVTGEDCGAGFAVGGFTIGVELGSFIQTKSAVGVEWVEWGVLLPVSLEVKSVVVQVLKLEALLLDSVRALDWALDWSEALPLD